MFFTDLEPDFVCAEGPRDLYYSDMDDIKASAEHILIIPKTCGYVCMYVYCTVLRMYVHIVCKFESKHPIGTVKNFHLLFIFIYVITFSFKD